MKFYPVFNSRPGDPDYLFFCPGCKCDHGVWINKSGYTGPTWNFDGNIDSPTVSPSILVNQGAGNPTVPVCHSFIKAGKIQYLSDSTHELAGQTIDLPEYE